MFGALLKSWIQRLHLLIGLNSTVMRIVGRCCAAARAFDLMTEKVVEMRHLASQQVLLQTVLLVHPDCISNRSTLRIPFFRFSTLLAACLCKV